MGQTIYFLNPCNEGNPMTLIVLQARIQDFFFSVGSTKKCCKPRSQKYWAINVLTVYGWNRTRNIPNCMKLWYACYKLSNIELEVYQQYMDELRTNRAANFDLQICMKLWYSRKACYKCNSIELEMHQQCMDELRATNFEAGMYNCV